MKKVSRLFLILSVTLFVGLLSSCKKEDVVLEEEPLQLFYKIEHIEGQYPHPINPLGPVITDSGYKYGIENGGSIYIKPHTELYFWCSDARRKVTWNYDHFGHGGSVIKNNSTLKTNYNTSGEYTLIIETPTIIRIKIIVD